MGICVVFIVLFLLSRLWVVNLWVYCYVWNVAHNTRWWRTSAFSRGNGGLLGLTTFWFTSNSILLQLNPPSPGNLNQTLIFTPFPGDSLTAPQERAREGQKRGEGEEASVCIGFSWVSCFQLKQTWGVGQKWIRAHCRRHPGAASRVPAGFTSLWAKNTVSHNLTNDKVGSASLKSDR